MNQPAMRHVTRNWLSLGALTLMVSVACSSAVLDEPGPAEQGDASRERSRNFSGTAVFLKNWRWHDIVSHLNELRAMNFTAILISPHTSSCGGEWSDGYDPSDFTSFWTRFGNEGDLDYLVRSTHATGMQIYANMVMNHMCTHGDFRYNRFGWNDFHHYGRIEGWDDQWWLENGDLFGLNDLCHECDYVRGELFSYLVKTNDLGFDGYRFDAAKHVPLWYWRDHVMNNVNAWGKYGYGEVYDGNPDVLHRYAETGMAVTDYALYFAMKDAFSFGGDLRRLDGAGYAIRNGAGAMTFAENHDVGPPQNRHLALAFIAAYPGYPMYHDVRLGDPLITNLAWVHNNKAYGSYINRWSEHDVLIFERQGHLLAGFNQSGSWQSRWVDTSWRNRKLHDFGGSTGDVWTGDDGRVLVSIPPVGYVLLGAD
jgi:alpha-amylase